MTLKSINPATGEMMGTYEEIAPEEAARAIVRCDAAFAAWRETSFSERGALMKGAASVLRNRREEYATLMALEMGKPVRQGRAEIEKCAWVCDYYAERAGSFLESEIVATDARKSFISYRPLGVILAVMPWNFPFWQVFRFAAPALMAGNAALLKHASNVCGCALAIEDVFAKAGFPAGLFKTLLAPSGSVEAFIAHPAVKAVTLTGSTPAGRAVASAAGRMLKKTVLELGGSDPYVIMEDADVEKAAAVCAESRLVNSGQSCIAAKRFIVTAPRERQFTEIFVQKMLAARVGDPLDGATDVGPLARLDLREELHRQVMESVASGAGCLTGGRISEGAGAYYPPTVLRGVEKGMSAYDEELFGPVAAIITVMDEEEAIRTANDTSFGLGAALFTKDLERAERIAASRIEAGSCFVNSFVKSDPRLPFGGIKDSGYGRELSYFGIREFVNIKTVYVA
ncbi:MAG: NAD-dependent succinate-semialdehyde dehydrogenase [Candidatus Krumholzibacteria bacterium]|nr:NAD-dependent succinate-semialdehyde dehydrogenase [Candidatus Krumholzibacteria bacterium]